MYTLKQCEKLQEMGYPPYSDNNYDHTYMCYYIDPDYTSLQEFIVDADFTGQIPCPTAEEALEWARNKIHNKYAILISATNEYYVELIDVIHGKHIRIGGDFDTLSDAVYALIIWAYENKLLEA